MALLRIPAERLGALDLGGDRAVRQRGYSHEPRAETRIRIRLDKVIQAGGAGDVVDRDLVGQLVRSIVDLVDATAVVLPPEEVSDGAADA